MKKSIRTHVVGLTLALVAVFAMAASYWFHISNAGPDYATSTLAQDQGNEFDGANRIARLFLHYTSPWAIGRVYIGQGDDVYISYHDGKIAKFKVVSPTDTIRLRFEKEVQSVPPDARRNGFEPYSEAPVDDTSGVGVSSRADYVDMAGYAWFFETYERQPSVEVFWYLDETWCNPCNEWTHPN